MLSNISWGDGYSVLFPSLYVGNSSDGVDSVLSILRDADESGGLMASRLKLCRQKLGRYIEHSWSAILGNDLAGSSREVQKFLYWSYPSGLHGISSMGTKLKKARSLFQDAVREGMLLESEDAQSDLRFIQKYEAFMLELMPLHDLTRELKSKPVPRQKSSVAPVNEKQVRGNCACCERDIAVTDGLIAAHGYSLRENYGGRTGTCFGHGYPPLQVSSKGLQALIEEIENGIKIETTFLRELPDRESVRFYRKGTIHVVKRDDALWDEAYKHVEAEARFRLKGLKRSLEGTQERLVLWPKTWKGKPLRRGSDLGLEGNLEKRDEDCDVDEKKSFGI